MGRGPVTKGVLASVAGSVLFSVMFWYVTLMDPLAGTEIFGWRMLLNAPVITLLVAVSGDWHRWERRPVGFAGLRRWLPASWCAPR
jgi:EamA domain-containing membrane protein RarD